MRARTPPTLARIVAALRRHYEAPPKPVSRDAFELILYVQVAYLATDAVRRAAFARLKHEVGLTPNAILDANPRDLVAITRSGGSIAAPVRAERMVQSARLVISKWDGSLRTAVELPVEKARAAIARFPMIGKPGADFILAATGAHAVLGLDSNALRVLVRLGFGSEGKSYDATYRSVQSSVAPQLPRGAAALTAISALLRTHGQELCKRSTPLCDRCPLRSSCAYARARD